MKLPKRSSRGHEAVFGEAPHISLVTSAATVGSLAGARSDASGITRSLLYFFAVGSAFGVVAVTMRMT